MWKLAALSMIIQVCNAGASNPDRRAFSLSRMAKSHRALKQYVEGHRGFFNRTGRYGEFLRQYGVSACADGDLTGKRGYVKRHVLENLLIDADIPDTHWDEYKLVYNKSYNGAREESASRAAWRDNLRLVAAHNRAYLASPPTRRARRLRRPQYALHLNHFADMAPARFIERVLKLLAGDAAPGAPPGPGHDPHRRAYHAATAADATLPDRVDWRERGFRPRLEEQWRCGACYAFAVAHAAQAQAYRRRADGRELSVQQLVDCSGVDGNYGCSGGSLRAALRYVSRFGLELETHYPYVGKFNVVVPFMSMGPGVAHDPLGNAVCLANIMTLGACRERAGAVRARAARWAVLPARDEAALARALHRIGPLAVAINAAPRTFQLYRSGVYDDAACVSTRVNHAMLLVGYTQHSWLLLNWWGEHWGEGGYMRISRGRNLCGIANGAAYVELV